MLGYNIPVLKTTTTPANPPSGFLKMYFKTDGKLYTLDSSGVEKDITNILRGNIEGALANQTDLNSALAGKEPLIGFTPENAANKSTTTTLGTSDTLYPTQNAVKVYTDTGLATKQATLVSGTNIKTVNGNVLLGAGNIVISAVVGDGDKGDITVSSSGTVWTLDDGTVGISKLSASGTANSTTFLRGDNTRATPPGGVPPVDSVNGQTGVVVLDASDVGAYADTNPSGFISDISGQDLSTADNSTSQFISDISGQDLSTADNSTSQFISSGDNVSELNNDSGYVTASSTDTFTNKRITARVSTEVSSSTPTINTDNVDMHRITALAATVTSFTTNLSGTPTDGQKLIISITDDGTARGLTRGASFEASGNVSLPTTTVISTRLDVGFIWNTTTSKRRCIATA